MSALNQKLSRDLWRMKGQAIAISIVIALGVLLLIMNAILIRSLEESRDQYYTHYRIADVFAPVKRAPVSILSHLTRIKGIELVQGRVRGRALIDMPDVPVPISADVISMPDYGENTLNDIYLVAGRKLEPAYADEIILLEGFAKAHGLLPGDHITATLNGSRKNLRIVGLAQSPEFLYAAPPGEFTPDDPRFAVIWMSEKALSSSYNLKGSYNEFLFSLSHNANLEEVKTNVDLILEPYGNLGSFGLSNLVSNRFIHEEINGLVVSNRVIPPFFLLVAAFLLNIVISRMIQSERVQIGLLKSFGYTNFEIGFHYLKFMLVIAIAGALLGCACGYIASQQLMGVYQLYYKFPFIVFQIDIQTILLGLVISILAALSGGVLGLLGIVSLTPAVAMRPAAPPDFSRIIQFPASFKSMLDQPSKMIIRRLLRSPLRTIGSVIGIASGMALSVGVINIMNSFDLTMDLNFNDIDRSDLFVTFTDPLSKSVVYELKSLQGVKDVESFRAVPAIFRNGSYTYNGAISGLIGNPRLYRAVDSNFKDIQLQSEGIILGTELARILNIRSGEMLTVEVREGRRPILEVPVIGIADTLIGSPAYMQIGALNRVLKEPDRVSGAYLKIDSLKEDSLYEELKKMPFVIRISIKNQARSAFEKLIDTGAGAVRYIFVIVSTILIFGIIYNSFRISFAESLHDLANFRVLGYTNFEVSYLLLGELGLISLVALPGGAILGYYFSLLISHAFTTDLYRIPASFDSQSVGLAIIAVVLAYVFSSFIVKREINKLDLVKLLKTPE